MNFKPDFINPINITGNNGAGSKPDSPKFSFGNFFSKKENAQANSPAPEPKANIFSTKDLDKLFSDTFIKKKYDQKFLKGLRGYEPEF